MAALRRSPERSSALPGAFKQTGVYVFLAVLLCWLVLRRAHKGHLVLAAVALTVIVTYVVIMVRVFDVPQHDWYIGQSTTQVRRVLGLQHSGGTLTSPHGVLHLLFAQYKYFIPSVLLALASFLIVVRRVLQCYQHETGPLPRAMRCCSAGW